MKYTILGIVIFFIILVSIQITLNKLLVVIKEINSKLDYILRKSNEDKFEK
ncbi:cation:proton antiporter [Peptoniphilus asaccharolyticus]|uniref:cation:proton antiporter n=1 Tax=Peptoniphilus asaccharolyticus TaxID=1258 RepID=UPI00190ECCC3|nr:cation:proton antiporter [Peptoniphilus asaccharolyticus]MBL7574891.1 cation:proton antiporter [Peptoniphilus asaccharolyticus]